ncbi:MAG: hypothetical protein COX70_07355 [Flavobacteriales bacterium CG_4_10_14_0_2_um_filter_32_8]|nr:MAG: hypothetical protein COX70_07355 [Flavobacteriales bacterium CG_4_10_14_0_2_um_filter_32_8]PJB15080.1 MAG: hypothetical protein CO118_05330 [Flavobacteriales bacterium CG_4_9_14_3_um_filter_32_8]
MQIKIMKKLSLIFLLFLLPFFGNTQNIGVGASALYNFQTESGGFGARVNFFPNKTISYVPQFTYYLFGPVSEYMIGLSIEFKVKRGNTFTYYLMAHGAYDQWLNAAASGMEGAQTTNWNLEGGVGITTNRCLRPFLEYRYNIKFMETHLRLGILYIFGCKSGNGYRDEKRVRKTMVCPAYN